MTDIGSTGYMSDGEITAWLEQKSSEQYGNLRNCMNISNDRADLIKQLTSLRADIDGGAKPEDVLAAMQKIQQECAGKTYGPEIDNLLLPMEAQLTAGVSGAALQQAASEVGEAIDQSGLSNKADLKGQVTTNTTTVIADTNSIVKMNDFTAGSATYKAFSEKLQGETDQLGRIDSLDLIKIQEIMSDAHQTDQLGSNILASRDQASGAIVGNIRG
jgi:hypothetical protein